MLHQTRVLAAEKMETEPENMRSESSLNSSNQYFQNHEYYEEETWNQKKEILEERTKNSTTYEVEDGIYETEFYTEDIKTKMEIW